MAKKTVITTGDTDSIKQWWEYAYSMKIGRIVDQTLLTITNTSSTSIISTNFNENTIEQKLRSGDLVTIYLSSESTAKATKWTYAFKTGITINIEGSLHLNKDGTLATTSKILKVSMTDAEGILYGIQTAGVTNTTGDISFAKAEDHVEITFKLNTFERIFLINGLTYSGSYGFINRIEKSSSDGNWSASGVIDQYTMKINSIESLKIEKIDNDQLNANDPEVVDALSSADKFIAYYLRGDDSLKSSDNDSFINGYEGNDTIFGGKGSDTLSGDAGNDSVVGGVGNDSINGGDGNDSINAGDGSDLIVGGDGAGNDTYDGGKGTDTVKYLSAFAAISIDLIKGTATSTTGLDTAGIGADKLKNIENIISGEYSDNLTGSKEANSIVGSLGNDTIDGGLGKDTLVGGDGADFFVFSTKPSTINVDTISDFQVGVDKLQLSSKVFTKLKVAADYLAFGTASDSKSHYLIYDSASGKLSYDADGNVSKIKPVDIALIGQGLNLTAQDIVIT
jgi:Ca2+-binding RTX toxin-like protein